MKTVLIVVLLTVIAGLVACTPAKLIFHCSITQPDNCN